MKSIYKAFSTSLLVASLALSASAYATPSYTDSDAIIPTLESLTVYNFTKAKINTGAKGGYRLEVVAKAFDKYNGKVIKKKKMCKKVKKVLNDPSKKDKLVIKDSVAWKYEVAKCVHTKKGHVKMLIDITASGTKTSAKVATPTDKRVIVVK